MKKTLRGKQYDSDTARLVFEWHEGRSEDHHVRQSLFRKKTGEYFLISHGGKETRYASHDGVSWAPGCVLEPLSFDQARSWAEGRMPHDRLREEFDGQGPGSTVVTWRNVSAAAKRLVEIEASRGGKTQGEVVSDCIISTLGR